MDRIVIVQAGNAKHAKELRCTKKRCDKFGYEHSSYNLGGLGFGTNFFTAPEDLERHRGFISCRFKPKMLRVESQIWDKQTILVYLDADVALVQSLGDLSFLHGPGAVLRPLDETEREAHQPDVGRINTGILFFRCDAKSKRFIDAWDIRSRQRPTEQRAFNELALEQPEEVTFLPRHEYHAYEPTGKAKLVHYKGGQAERVHDHCETSCEG